MKQYRWIIALGIAAIVLTGVFIFVDKLTKDKKEKAKIGGPKQLFSINADDIERITLDNEEGQYAFEWNDDAHRWMLIGDDSFDLNSYAVIAICNQICNLKSQKTVAFDCQDTAPFGFDHPVTVKVFTTKTDEDHPYVLYVGSNTPTYDSYYAMVEASNDVYTIDYTAGSVFCVAKDTLKTMYLFDTFGSQMTYYKCETDGVLPIEIKRNEDSSWTMIQPAPMTVFKANADNLMETIVRVTMEKYIEENPSDLKKYGLDKPWSKLVLQGKRDGIPAEQEIWFGALVSDDEKEVNQYAYLPKTKQVIEIGKAMTSFIKDGPNKYILPYCYDVNIEQLSGLDIDMGSVYDMKESLTLDYANNKFTLSGREIDAKNESLLSLFQAYYRSISNLSFSDLALDAKPEGDPDITIVYHLRDGKDVTLGFVPLEQNNYALMKDGSYTGQTVRLNRFTGSSSVVPCYEELKKALN